jgi:hypothetical protein
LHYDRVKGHIKASIGWLTALAWAHGHYDGFPSSHNSFPLLPSSHISLLHVSHLHAYLHIFPIFSNMYYPDLYRFWLPTLIYSLSLSLSLSLAPCFDSTSRPVSLTTVRLHACIMKSKHILAYLHTNTAYIIARASLHTI